MLCKHPFGTCNFVRRRLYNSLSKDVESLVSRTPSTFREDTDSVVMKHDRIRTSLEMARLERSKLKIDALNPYERIWGKDEHKWKNDWHHHLLAPRMSYELMQNSNNYDSLAHCEYSTKTHTKAGQLPTLFKGLNAYNKRRGGNHRFPHDLQTITDQLAERLCRDLSATNMRDLSASELSNTLMQQICTRAFSIASPHFPHLRNATVNTDCDIESFWIRGGYDYLYNFANNKKKYVGRKTIRVRGDDRRKIGELAMNYKGKAALQIRHEMPLPQIEWPYHCQQPVPIMKAMPSAAFKLNNEYVTQLSGFETDMGEPCEFSSLVLVDCSPVHGLLEKWKALPEENQLERSLQSTAVATAFATLNAQAHALGFTQHNDLLVHPNAVPLVTHVVLTDGRMWYFCTYQLNTIDLLNPYIHENTVCNLAYTSGPHYLYQHINEIEPATLNKSVLTMLLQLMVDKPVTPVDENGETVDMRPYLGNKAVSRWSTAFHHREVIQEEKAKALGAVHPPQMISSE